MCTMADLFLNQLIIFLGTANIILIPPPLSPILPPNHRPSRPPPLSPGTVPRDGKSVQLEQFLVDLFLSPLIRKCCNLRKLFLLVSALLFSLSYSQNQWVVVLMAPNGRADTDSCKLVDNKIIIYLRIVDDVV